MAMTNQFRKRLGKLRIRWVRNPVVGIAGRALRVLIYVRYSTAEQRRRSIKAQIEYCKNFLADLTSLRVEITVLKDERLSGELRERPGINEVWKGVGAGKWDLILTEDASRLYRDDVWCVELVRLAVDKGARVICIGDFVDTTEPDWEVRLKESARFHAASNRLCSQRVKRGHEELWDVGAALGLLKPGFYRVPSEPAKDGMPAKGPFFDEIDGKWAPVIKEAYERIAAGESPRLVGLWLTEAGLPKVPNSKSRIWSGRNVIALIRRTIYRGVESYRDSVATKELTTGKHLPKANEAEEVLTRFMPHLRMVEDWLWYAANKAIDERAPATTPLQGRDHPHYRVPRDSRGPFAGIYFCVCGAKMHGGVRTEGGYRCSASGKTCWIKMTVTRQDAHQRIGVALSNVLRGLNSELDAVIQTASRLLEDAGRRATAKDKLTLRRTKLQRALQRLNSALADGERPPQSIVQEIKKREVKLARTDARIEALELETAECFPPTRSEIETRMEHLQSKLTTMDRTIRDELKVLVGSVSSVPFQQFGSDKVVPRARFEIRLWGLLPTRTRAALASMFGDDVRAHFATIPQLIDLFQRSTGPEFGLAALALDDQKIGLTAIGKQLGITKRQADIAVQYGRSLREAGRTDPFLELTSAPEQASRWRAPGTGKRQGKKNPPPHDPAG